MIFHTLLQRKTQPEKSRMKDKEPLLTLGGANQRLEERWLAGTPQLEVRRKNPVNERRAWTHPSRISPRQLWGRGERNHASALADVLTLDSDAF